MVVALATRSSALLLLSVVTAVCCLNIIVDLERFALGLLSIYRRPGQLQHSMDHKMTEHR
jgi:hypothetical protein